eukprot:scaffold20051_cov95-Isochrysis_galbana.AAC.2
MACRRFGLAPLGRTSRRVWEGELKQNRRGGGGARGGWRRRAAGRARFGAFLCSSRRPVRECEPVSETRASSNSADQRGSPSWRVRWHESGPKLRTVIGNYEYPLDIKPLHILTYYKREEKNPAWFSHVARAHRWVRPTPAAQRAP